MMLARARKGFTSLAAALSVALLLLAPVVAAEIKPPKFEITTHVLDNGLKLVMMEDHTAPIVAVNLWYHVGSKNESPGRTGFAHLFEHMMFQGSEHYNEDFFKGLEPIGATDLNGTTNNDRTNYFENVPVNALERALWLEADRMGWLLPAMTQERLDNQREVVKNERRQSYENQPYGLVNERMYTAMYPKNHPYSWPVIGSMEDLSNASKEDVEDFFRTYYGPNNCTLVVVGDIDIEHTKALVRKYFGAIPPGPPISRQKAWVPPMTQEVRLSMEDRVPLPRLYAAWHMPGWFEQDEAEMEILARILGGGKNSRLYRRLVYDMQIAQDVAAFVASRELSSLFRVRVTAKQGHTLSEIEPIVNEEIARLRSTPPTAREVERAKTGFLSGMLRGLDRIGGFGGKSDLLGRYTTYVGKPDYIEEDFARINRVTAAGVQKAASRWLGDGRTVMHVEPFPELKAAPEMADLTRGTEPALGETVKLKLPTMERARLSNGMEVIVARNTKIPAVRVNLVVRGGWSSDARNKLGLASFTGNMLDEGTASRSALEISEEMELLGAQLGTGSGLDTWQVGVTALKARLEPSLELWADVIMNPSFPEEEIERQRKQTLGRILQEKRQPTGMALRIMPGLLYGDDHPYGQPLTGSGTEASIGSINRKDLVDAHSAWFKSNNATAVVVGDTTVAEIVPLLEKSLGKWKQGELPTLRIPEKANREATTVYIIDKPGAAQSMLIAGTLAPPKNHPDDIPFDVLNTVLGGQFTSRLNMNLREDKGYSYGAGTFKMDARNQGAFLGFSAVRTDVTKESLVEMMKEFRDIRGSRPVTGQEMAAAQARLTLQMPGQYESLNEIENMITQLVTFDLPENYYQQYPEIVRTADQKMLTRVANSMVLPDQMVFVVVGDREQIEDGIESLGFGEVRYLDVDGNPVTEAPTVTRN